MSKEFLAVTVIRSYPYGEVTSHLWYEFTIPDNHKGNFPKQILPQIVGNLARLSYASERPTRDTRKLIDRAIKVDKPSSDMCVRELAEVVETLSGPEPIVHSLTYRPQDFEKPERTADYLALRVNGASVLLKVIHPFGERGCLVTQDLEGVLYTVACERHEDGTMYAEINTLKSPYDKPLVVENGFIHELDAVREDNVLPELVALNISGTHTPKHMKQES